jgi:hypothetical protein
MTRPRAHQGKLTRVLSTLAITGALIGGGLIGGGAPEAHADVFHDAGCFRWNRTVGVVKQSVYVHNTCNSKQKFRVKTVSWFTESCVSVSPNGSAEYKWTKGRKFNSVVTPC